MALAKYNQKRDPSKTPEPFGGESKNTGGLRFVIQKHAASHQHYDFRLEMEGVLKSWAVPKGPSTDPGIKRLAMMVEDHPYDYRTFEGVIPQGEYGAGTVIVWDEGTYAPAEPEGTTKEAHDKQLRHALHTGKLRLVLKGKKLKGEFALVMAKGRGDNGWLLMSLEDRHAATSDITAKDKSVISGKTVEQVAAGNTISGQSDNRDTEKPKKKIGLKETPEAAALLIKGRRSRQPSKVKPMLATLVDEPFDAPGWGYEVKWDGYRALSYISKGKAVLYSRNNKPFTAKYYPIAKAMEKWTADAVLDGEILVIRDDGRADFGALQNWRSEADGHLVYYVFDLLWYEGKDLMQLPLAERQALLKEVLPASDLIRISQVFTASGFDFFEAAKKMGLEGIMAKRLDSTYNPDARSKEWLKVKAGLRQEVVIGGFTNNEGSPKPFSSLLLGVYHNGTLEYVGKVGTGFSNKKQKEMMALFGPLVTKENPFSAAPDVNKPSRFRPDPPKATATWLKPLLVCEVGFAEVTSDGVFRHPSFKGMRTDKKASEVVRERATAAPRETTAQPDEQGLVSAPDRTAAKTLLNPTEETQVKKVSGHALKFTNLSKLYWPVEGYTKRDMFNYYYQVAEYILPYLQDRPLSLNRFPGGITGKSFYQKDVKGKAPDWAATFPYATSQGEGKEFLVGGGEDTLLWMASLGCIEMNPWFSRIQHPDNPDYCVIDLDPGEKTSFEQVIAAACEVKKVLDALEITGYVKTSGSTGIHIYIPLGAKYSYDQSQLFARLIVGMVHDRIPAFTSLERQVKKRGGKMYLDFLQNRPGATIACPYSLRPKPGATVSMPLHWEEVRKGLAMNDFTIINALQRIKSEGDLFKGCMGSGIDMAKALALLNGQ